MVDAPERPAWRHGGPVKPWEPWIPPWWDSEPEFGGGGGGDAGAGLAIGPNGTAAVAPDRVGAGAPPELDWPCYLFARKFSPRAGERLRRYAGRLLELQ